MNAVRSPWLWLSSTLALLVLAAAPAALAEAPRRLWTEKRFAKPLDPDAPISMRAFSRLATELSPAVVNISVERGGPAIPSIFGPGGGGAGLGTGFIVHADGYVLTNNHVVKGAANIRVKLASEREYPAEVVGTYPQLDVALLKIAARERLTAAPLGDSRALQIGEWVVAIGNPFGLNHTVTAGIVSAKGRRDVVAGAGEPLFARFIQTDASINPGNSGGPLINIRGEVVGINTAINAAGQGIGFAVPVDMVKKILPQLATGHVSRSYLGVRVGPVTRDLAQRLNLARPVGALVREVLTDTPAASAGLRPGDVLLRWNGQPVEHWEDLPWLASTAGEGREVEVVVNRSGREVPLTVELTHFPGEVVPPHRAAPRTSAPRPRPEAGTATVPDLGLSVGPVPARDRRSLGLNAGEGVVVVEVQRGGVADSLDLRPGDVITQVNYTPLTGGAASFVEGVSQVGAGELLSFTIRRGDRHVFKAITR